LTSTEELRKIVIHVRMVGLRNREASYRHSTESLVAMSLIHVNETQFLTF